MNKFQDKVATEKTIRHTDASSRSNILQHVQNLQKARAHNVTFCNFKEISQKLKRNTMEVPKDSPRWDVHRNSINLLQCFYDILRDSKRLHMEFKWNSSGVSNEFHWIPMGFLQESFGMSMIFLIFLPSSDDISLK